MAFDEVSARENLKAKGYPDNAINYFIDQKKAGAIKPLPYSKDNPTFNIEEKPMFAKQYSENIGPIGDFFSHLYNATIPELTKGVVELPNLVAGVAGTDALKQGTDNAVDWIDKRLGMYVDPAFQKGMFNLDEKGDLSFTDARSFANGLGQGIGSFLSMMIPGAGLSKLGAGANISTMVGATLTSIPMLYKGGKEAGLSNQANSAMTLFLAPIIGMLENVGGVEAEMIGKMMGKEATQEVTKASERTLVEALGRLGSKGAAMTAEDFALTAKESINGLRPLLGRILNKNVAKNAWGEFEEEYLQNIVQEGAEQMYDTFFAKQGAEEGTGKYHNPENELLINEVEGFTGGSASVSPVDWIAKGLGKRYNKQVWKEDLGAAIYGAIIGHGLTSITTPIVNQSLYGYIDSASSKASQGAPRIYNQMNVNAGGQQAVKALGVMTNKMLQSGKITQEQAQQIGQTVAQMAETAHNLSGIEGMTPAISYDAYNAQFNQKPKYEQAVAGYEQAVQQVTNMMNAVDPQTGQPVPINTIALAKAQKDLAEGYDNYRRAKDMVSAIDDHLHGIVQGRMKGDKNVNDIAKGIANNKYDIATDPSMKDAMKGYSPKEQKKAQSQTPAVTISQLVGQPISMNGVNGTVAKDENGVYVFHPEGEADIIPIGDKDVPAKDLGISHDESIKPKNDAIQKPSTEKKVSPAGKGGKNIPQGGSGVGQGQQGNETSGTGEAEGEKPQGKVEYTFAESKGKGWTVLKDGDYISDENGQVTWHKSKEEAQAFLDKIQNKEEPKPNEPEQEEKGKLPKDLSGAKPRYGYGPKTFQLDFESDIDKAAYITAQNQKSKRDADYVKFVMDETGMTEEEVREHGRKVRDRIKSIAKSQDSGVIVISKEPIISPAAQEIIDENKQANESDLAGKLFKDNISNYIFEVISVSNGIATMEDVETKKRVKKKVSEIGSLMTPYEEEQQKAHENEINDNANDLIDNEQNAEEAEIIINIGIPLELEGELGRGQNEGVDNGAGAGGIGEGDKQGSGKDKQNVNAEGDGKQVPDAEGSATNEISFNNGVANIKIESTGDLSKLSNKTISNIRLVSADLGEVNNVQLNIEKVITELSDEISILKNGGAEVATERRIAKQDIEFLKSNPIFVTVSKLSPSPSKSGTSIPPAPATIPAPSNLKAKWVEARKEGKYTADTIEHTRNEPMTNVVLGAEGASNFSAEPDAQNVPFRYALVSLDEVQPTHKGVRENPQNFIMEGQPKADVSKEALSARDVQNQKFAKNFNNTQQGPSGASPYDGFSNVNQRGEIFQGTGRWNILNHYYNTHANEGSYDARIQYLKSIAPQLGFTVEQIDDFVKNNSGKIDVVKMYNVTDEQAIRLGQYDGSDKEAKVQGAKENQMAAKITPEVLVKIRQILAGGVSPDSRGLQILQAKAKAIIDQLVADGVITAGEYQGYFDANNNPQISAITAIQDILLRIAYPNNASLVSKLPGAVRQALSKSLPFVLSVEEAKSISSSIDKAIGAYNEYVRETGGLLAMSADDWLNTVDSLRQATKKSELTALEQELVKLFAEGKENQIELHFRDYQQATVGTSGLFGNVPAMDRAQAVNKVFGVDYAESVSKGSNNIARSESAVEKKKREIAERMARLKGMGPKGTLTLDPEMLAEVIGLAIDYAQLGYLNFSDFVRQMYRDDMGQYAPYFREAYKKVKDADLSKEIKDGLDEDEEVDSTDIKELEKKISDEQERAKQILEASERRTKELTSLRVESRTEFDGTNLAEGIDTRPALRYSYADYIPNVPISVENNQYPFMNKYQMRVVNLIISAFKRGKPAFLLGDDTGTGKTATILVTANEIALLEKARGTNRRVLIVTMNKVIADERFMVDMKKINSKNPIQPVSKNNGIEITTYDSVHKFTGEEFAAILYDESQEIANINSAANKEYKAMKTDFVVFASATPFQTPIASLYALAKVTGATEDEMAHELGFYVAPDPFKQDTMIMHIPGGSDGEVAFWLEYAKRLGELAKQFISDGLHIRRSYPFWGKTFEEDVTNVVPAQFTNMMNNVVLNYNSWISNVLNGRTKDSNGKDDFAKKAEARRLGKQKSDNSEYLLEMAKINKFLFKEIKDKLADGKSVIIATKFKGQVYSAKNPKIPKDGKYYQLVKQLNPKGMAREQYLPTATQLLKDWLVKEGIAFGEITGNVSDVNRKKAMNQFQTNQVRVVVMTMDSGGTGIDLDDQTGTNPRVMYVTSQGWSASQLKQLVGRISRLTTKSPSEIHFLRIPGAHAEGKYKIRSRMKSNILGALNDEADIDMVGDKDYMAAKQVEVIFNSNKQAMARKNISNLAEAVSDWNAYYKLAKTKGKVDIDELVSEWEEEIKKC